MSKHVPKFKNDDIKKRSEKVFSEKRSRISSWMEAQPICTPENDPDVELKDGVWVDVDHSGGGGGGGKGGGKG